MTRIRHNITTGWLLVLVGAPLAALFSIPKVGKGLAAKDMQAASMAPAKQVRDMVDADIKAIRKGSDLPLRLVSANRCSPMVLTSNGQLPEFVEGLEVVARTPEGQVLPAGSYVCNAAGFSATVGVDSKLVNVQSTPLEKLEEYKETYSLMLQLQGREVK